MKSYLTNLLFTKNLSNEARLDIALILTIIPHLFVLKAAMLVFVAVALLVIIKGYNSKGLQIFMMLFGLLVVGISFFNNYNVSNFTGMQFFVSFVSSLLILAVALQRITGLINIYQKFAPLFLMLLGFFFFNNFTMLFYTLFTLFTLTLLLIWERMDATFFTLGKKTLQLFFLSLPLVIILFLTFPRISFDRGDFGFRDDAYSEYGYDGLMRVSSKGVKLSNKTIMEVSYKEPIVDEKQLYFRGSTLAQQDGITWKNLPHTIQNELLTSMAKPYTYTMTLVPHANKWVYTSYMPKFIPMYTEFLHDHSVQSLKPLFKPKRFTINSVLEYKLLSTNLALYLVVDKVQNERTHQAIKYIENSSLHPQQKAVELLNFFKKQQLAYSTKPSELDEKDATDSFLFDTKQGYCVHYASAFATSARLLGIPSRVVTGFKADAKNMIENYLIVKKKDAHAWVELYFEDEGWVLFEPTTTHAKNLDLQQNTDEIKLFEKLNNQYMYYKYILTSWTLDYNRSKQMKILKQLLSDTLYLLKFIAIIALLSAASILFYIIIKQHNKHDPLEKEIQKLLKVLKKTGLEKQDSESMHSFLGRCEQKLNISCKSVDLLYHTYKYSEQKSSILLQEIITEIRQLKSDIKETK